MQAKKRILIAEDNAALSTVLQFNLRHAGFEAVTVGNGRQAWQRVQQEPFDLVITDQQMPEMTGIEFCRQVRGAALFGELPIVLLTAKSLELDVGQLRQELELAAVFGKPFSPSALVECVRELCREGATEPVR